MRDERCWCGHAKRWHQHGVCIWCARKEARRPQIAQLPKHDFDTEVPEELLKEFHRRVSPVDRWAERFGYTE